MSAMGLDLGISMDFEAGADIAPWAICWHGRLTLEASATGGDLFERSHRYLRC